MEQQIFFSGTFEVNPILKVESIHEYIAALKYDYAYM